MTDAEVEAVTRAIEGHMFAPHELPLDAELHAKYLDNARGAIAALDAVRASAITGTELRAQCVALLGRHHGLLEATKRARAVRGWPLKDAYEWVKAIQLGHPADAVRSDGWRLVPLIATEEMRAVGITGRLWCAVLDAAPTPQEDKP